MSGHRCVCGLVAMLIALPAFAQQPTGPKAAFVSALGRFSLALEGALGDERGTLAGALGDMERALSDWDDTIRTYEAAMAAEIGSASPDLAARMHLALAGIYLDRQRVDPALRELMAARRLDPARPDVLALLAVAHSQLAASDAALEALREAAARDPGDPLREYLLAQHLTTAETQAERLAALRRFLDHERLRAALEARTAVPAPFIRASLVGEATGVEPFFPPARYRAGFDHLRRGEFDRALAAFRDALSGDPLGANAGPHREAMDRAAAALRDGSVASAVEALVSATTLAPERAEPHRMLGRAYAVDERYDEAAEAFRNAVRLDPRDERARIGLAGALLEAGDLAAARDALQEAMAVLPGSGRARYDLARLFQRQGQRADALREFAAAAAFEPLLGLNGLYETMGTLHAAGQEFEAAEAAYRRRVELHPNDPGAHLDLGDIYLRQGRHDEALAEFSVVLLLDPAHAKAAVGMAQTHLRQGQYAEAAAAARRALDADPAESEARYVLGTSLIRLGRAEEGKQELGVFQRRQAEAAAARSRMLEVEGLRRDAAVNAADGRHAETVALLRRVLELERSHVSHLELGLALLDAGQPAEAVEQFNASARLEAPYHVHRYLAAAYEALGRTADSQRELAAYERIRREALRRRSSTGSTP